MVHNLKPHICTCEALILAQVEWLKVYLRRHLRTLDTKTMTIDGFVIFYNVILLKCERLYLSELHAKKELICMPKYIGPFLLIERFYLQF